MKFIKECFMNYFLQRYFYGKYARNFSCVDEFILRVEFQERNFTRHTNELLSFFTCID